MSIKLLYYHSADKRANFPSHWSGMHPFSVEVFISILHISLIGYLKLAKRVSLNPNGSDLPIPLALDLVGFHQTGIALCSRADTRNISSVSAIPRRTRERERCQRQAPRRNRLSTPRCLSRDLKPPPILPRSVFINSP